MSFCRCPVDIRKKNAYGDEWCSICGAIRHTKQPPAPEPATTGVSMFDCPHAVIIGDHFNGPTTLVQCSSCARIGTRIAGSIRWFDVQGPRTVPGPPAMRRTPMPQFEVHRQDTEEKIWSGEAENVGAALEKARDERPELTDIPLVGTGTQPVDSSKR